MNLDRRLWGQAWAMRLQASLAGGATLLVGIAIVWQALLLSRIVAAVFLEGSTREQVSAPLLALLAVIAGRAVLVWVREVAAHQTALRVKERLRERFVAHLLALGPRFTSGERTGELVNTAVAGIEALDAYFAQYLPNLALAALVPLTILIFVFPLDGLSAIVLLATAPLLPLFMILIGKIAEALTRRQWETLSRLSAHFLDVLQGLTTLKLFGQSDRQGSAVAEVSERFRRQTMSVLRVSFLSALVLELLATISTAVVAVEIGLRLLYGTISFEQAFFVLILAPEFYLPLRNLGASFHAGMSGVAAAQRVFAVLEVGGGPSRPIAEGDRAGDRPAIRFVDVHFAYEDEREALRGVSFDLPFGQKVALVGPSGAGKSTIAHLLLRFIEPQRGGILVDGKPLGQWSARAWREQVTWVPQSPYLFDATVAQNIALARPGAAREEIEKAARWAGAHDFVVQLPQGYDTPIGERGARLSGGEAQRLALARAYLKDAPLLILDEPASSLDPEMEALVQEAIERLGEGRTVLIIAHRLGTTRRADRVVVLDHGLVVENGEPAALLERDGAYRHLVAAYGGGA